MKKVAVPADDHGSRLPLVDLQQHHSPNAPSSNWPSARKEITVPAAVGCRPTLPHVVPGAPPLHTHPHPPGPAPPAAPPSAPCPAPVRSQGAGSAGLQLRPCTQQRRAAPSPHLGVAPGRNAPAVLAAPGLAWGGPAERRTPPPRPARSSTAALARAQPMAKATSGAPGLGLKLFLLLPLLGEGESYRRLGR